ncbi:hypothetical protein JTE90_005835 [Oedothorax gibbosus]|uniref:Uncharacterized protein n=1 Tax=Oedothorax gibbosus TaxID=931172 RepID=A0AAV6V2I1_9ARAC|nr:hypothetical protein JTE90_005835 [Oedothorax gibbosus]
MLGKRRRKDGRAASDWLSVCHKEEAPTARFPSPSILLQLGNSHSGILEFNPYPKSYIYNEALSIIALPPTLIHSKSPSPAIQLEGEPQDKEWALLPSREH